MCGFCIETIQLDMLEREKEGKRLRELYEPGISWSYLQEADDLFPAIAKIRAAGYRKKLDPFKLIPSEVLICRALDILLTEGFASPDYQRLLRSRLFQRAIDEACSAEKKAGAASSLLLKHLSCLYQGEFFHEPGLSINLKCSENLSGVRHECGELLNAYIRTNLSARSTFDPANLKVVWPDDMLDHLTVFRALYAALLLIDKAKTGRHLRWAIVEQTPDSPDMYGYSLWLQRRAFLQLAAIEGTDALAARAQHLRGSLFRYLHLKIGLSPWQKLKLKSLALAAPGGNIIDNDFNMLDWLAESGC